MVFLNNCAMMALDIRTNLFMKLSATLVKFTDWIIKMIMWFDTLFWLSSAQTVHCFSKWYSWLNKYSDFHNMALKNFWLEVANKKPLSTKTLPLPLGEQNEISWLLKQKGIFFTTTNFVFQSKYVVVYCFKKWIVESHVKLGLNTSTWNFLNQLQLTNVKKIKGTGGVIGTWHYIIYLFICSNLYIYIDWCTCVKERKPYFLH